jgi:hypothetical protein
MTATDHEYQRLASGIWKMREIVIQAVDRLEIDEKLSLTGAPPH